MSKIKPISIVQSMSGKVCYPTDAEPTEAQLKAQERFAKVSVAVDTILQDPEEKAKYLTAFKAQHKVGNLRGYIFKKISPLYDENGELKTA